MKALAEALSSRNMPDNMRYFLGADVGATKTHVLIADESGQAVGFGTGGPGNHESVGFDGLATSLGDATRQALARAHLSREQIAGAGFGIAGYDWPQERPAMLDTVATLNLNAPVEAVNDTVIGLIAGASEGWGVAVVSGTGCNCRGWDKERKRQGQVTGNSALGEHTGSTDLVEYALQRVAHAWTRRGPPTQLTQAFVRHAGLRDIDELLFEFNQHRLELTGAAAPLIFEAAFAGDAVALEVLTWGGQELGEMANAVIRQLEFESLTFEVVLVGSLFNGGPLLLDPMREKVHSFAPGASFVRLNTPPVIGAVLLGMEQAKWQPTPAIRETLAQSINDIRQESSLKPENAPTD